MKISDVNLSQLSDDLELRKASLGVMVVVAARLLAEAAGISLDEARSRIVEATVIRLKEGA